MTAHQIAEMANKAEAEIMQFATEDFRNWYFSLPRKARVELAISAYEQATA
jgi:hypothetical protein